MKHRVPDPLRLDIAAFTADAGALEGVWSGIDLTRLSDSQTLPQDAAAGSVQWHLQGERVATSVGDPEQWLRLSASTTVWVMGAVLSSLQEPVRSSPSTRLSVSRGLRMVTPRWPRGSRWNAPDRCRTRQR